jgi:hypothetical protein
MQVSITYNQTKRDVKRKVKKLVSRKIKQLKKGDENND